MDVRAAIRLQCQHALQSYSCPIDYLVINNYLVDNLAFDQSLKHPGQVGRMDAIHGRTGADNRVKAEDELFRMCFCQAMHKVYLRSDRPLASGWSLLNLLDDVLGRTVEIGCFDYLTTTFRVNQYFYTWILGSRFVDLLHIEAHMRGAVPFPEDNAGTFDFLVSII